MVCGGWPDCQKSHTGSRAVGCELDIPAAVEFSDRLPVGHPAFQKVIGLG